MRYDIRAMSFGEILDTGFQLLRNHFVLLVGLGLVLYGPLALLGVLSEALGQSTAAGGTIGLVGIISIGLSLIVIAPIVSTAIILALVKLYVGEPVTFGDALREALSLTLPVVGTSFLAGCVVGFVVLLMVAWVAVAARVVGGDHFSIGMLALGGAISAGPVVWVFLSFVLLRQVMVMERVFGTIALRRSHELVKGHRGRAFGITLVGTTVVGIIGLGLQLAFGLVPFIGPFGSALAQAIGNVYTTAIAVVFYFDVRCRKEAFDLEHLANLVGRPAQPPPLPALTRT